MRTRLIAVALAFAAAAFVFATAAAADKPEIDPTWANGQEVNMIGPHLIPDAVDTQPNLYAHAEELYLLVFPQPPDQPPPDPATAGPITAGGGYQPQCNPCFHPGLPHPLVYHDHVISGAPGMGNNGTAGDFKGPWKIIVLIYNPAYAYSPSFHPITSQAAIDNAEDGTTNVFLKPPNAGSNPYEIETGNVLICPIVSSHA
jgi:hypothetical protein